MGPRRAGLASLAAVMVLGGVAGGPGKARATPPDEEAPLGPDAVVDEVEALMDGPTDQEEEERILARLRAVPPETLDAVVRRLDLGALLGDLDDHPGGPQHRTDLLHLLARTRVAALSTAARAVFVSTLQRGSTEQLEETMIRDVLLATKGAELTRLKNSLDEGGDHHDLEQLVFHDIDDDAVRDAILAHCAREADGAPSGEVKVLSDIDDTIYRNWVDERYPSKAVYPGVRALYRELDVGADEKGRPGDLAFLTARPGDRVGLVEEATIATLGELGVPRFVVLTGALLNLTSNEAIAEGKFEAFERYRRLYPEYGFVFTGDSGQGDHLLSARLMAERKDVTRAVFINDVVGTPPEGRSEWLARGVPFFDTYVGSALHAHERGLISRAGLARVARAARDDLRRIAFPSAEAREARRAELERDIARVNEVLPEPERVR